MASRDAYKVAKNLVPPTCPEVDKAFEECIRIVKERGTELLREALENVCADKIDLEKEKEDLEDQVAKLENEVKDLREEIKALDRKVVCLEDENGDLLRDLEAATSRGT